MPHGKSPPRPRKGKGSDKVWVSLGIAALTAAATVTAAAVSGGGHSRISRPRLTPALRALLLIAVAVSLATENRLCFARLCVLRAAGDPGRPADVAMVNLV